MLCPYQTLNLNIFFAAAVTGKTRKKKIHSWVREKRKNAHREYLWAQSASSTEIHFNIWLNIKIMLCMEINAAQIIK